MGSPELTNSSGMPEALLDVPKSIEEKPEPEITVLTEQLTAVKISVSINLLDPDTAPLKSVVPP